MYAGSNEIFVFDAKSGKQVTYLTKEAKANLLDKTRMTTSNSSKALTFKSKTGKANKEKTQH